MNFWERLVDRLKPGGVGRATQRNDPNRERWGNRYATYDGMQPSRNAKNTRESSGRVTNLPKALHASKPYKGPAPNTYDENQGIIPISGIGNIPSKNTGENLGSPGLSVFDELMNQIMGGSGTYTSPEYEVDQIDVDKTLKAIFDPQFQAIADAESKAKSRHGESSKAIQAAYDALTNHIRTEGASDIKDSYSTARDSVSKSAATSTQNLADVASRQYQEEAELNAALGIASAMSEDTGGRRELNRGISDINESAQGTSDRLSELETVDRELNRSAADVSGLQGANHQTNLQRDLNQTLDGYGGRRVDTTVAQANRRADLEAQNQAAVQAANQLSHQDYQNFMSGQSDVMKQAISLQMEKAKMNQDWDIAQMQNAANIYKTDSSVDIAQMNNAAKAAGASQGAQGALEELVSRGHEGLSTENLVGIVDNLTRLNTDGNWDNALTAYYTQYPNHQRSKRAAAEYVNILKRAR